MKSTALTWDSHILDTWLWLRDRGDTLLEALVVGLVNLRAGMITICAHGGLE
jgi:hypothetical protein